jgi:hypothetical protein
MVVAETLAPSSRPTSAVAVVVVAVVVEAAE